MKEQSKGYVVDAKKNINKQKIKINGELPSTKIKILKSEKKMLNEKIFNKN